MIRYWFAMFACVFIGCISPTGEEEVSESSEEALVVDCGGVTRYPTTEEAFRMLYAGRSFQNTVGPGSHLGHDVSYAVGTAISPVLCGEIKYYGPAGGYGTLVVAIEHKLNRPVYVTNGAGDRVSVSTFLSIYGHLRTTATPTSYPLTWQVGQIVGSSDIIGYVQEDAHNGDGGPHLHLGIRLQSKDAAVQTDGRYWLRGYDSTTSRRAYFANPATFLRELISLQEIIVWHPPGTYLTGGFYTDYVVGEDGESMYMIDYLMAERLGFRSRGIRASFDELSCYREMGPYQPKFSDLPGRAPFVARSQTEPAVWMFYGDHQGVLHRDVFLSWESFLSHGYESADVTFFDPFEWGALQRSHTVQGVARLQEGSLVKAKGSPAIYVISSGRRRPIFNWNTFQAMGYDVRDVYEIDGATLDTVAGPLGDVIRLSDATRCHISD